jgi:hypothetical protein
MRTEYTGPETHVLEFAALTAHKNFLQANINYLTAIKKSDCLDETCTSASDANDARSVVLFAVGHALGEHLDAADVPTTDARWKIADALIYESAESAERCDWDEDPDPLVGGLITVSDLVKFALGHIKRLERAAREKFEHTPSEAAA